MILATCSVSLGAIPWETQLAGLKPDVNQPTWSHVDIGERVCQRAGGHHHGDPLEVVKRTCSCGRRESRVSHDGDPFGRGSA